MPSIRYSSAPTTGASQASPIQATVADTLRRVISACSAHRERQRQMQQGGQHGQPGHCAGQGALQPRRQGHDACLMQAFKLKSARVAHVGHRVGAEIGALQPGQHLCCSGVG